MKTPILIADFAAGDLLENAAGGGSLVAQGFDELWQNTLNGGLYAALCRVGILFAVGSLVLFIVQWGKQMLDGDEIRAVSELIWPLVVGLLLSNNGAILAQSTLVLRDYINSVNKFVLEFTAADADLTAAYQQALGHAAMQTAVGSAIEECRSANLSNEQVVQCLTQARTELQSKFPELFKDPDSGDSYLGAAGSWIMQELGKIDQATQEAQGDGLPGIANQILSGASAAVGAILTTFVTSLLLALNNAYQWGLEFSLLLTALLGPLAVGGSLLPFGSKAIMGWLTGFFSVGIAKLSFNIILGLAGLLISTAQASQPMIFLAFIGLVAPFLATGLAAGGGIAVLLQLNKSAAWASSGGVIVMRAAANKLISFLPRRA
ncbi:MAG TPA: hypothetical protein DCZ55_01825 [Cyanobacteria bacterium UBA11371]|nr:hypothetical protein [Cyanobacteria bacterium UBA11371]HBE31137.1 hypothetical protein [Cyanobacteria bacterium UBA11368]